MAAFLNNCRFIPAAGATTDWAYASTVGGCQSPALAGAIDGRKYKFIAISTDLTQWEIAEGAYTAASGTFARTTVLYNSSGSGTSSGQSGAGTKISFTVAPNVAIVGVKEDLISIEEANTFTAAQMAQARANIGVQKKNYIINGGMQVSQENGSTAGSITAYYAVDQFALQFVNSTGVVTAAQVASATPGGSPNRFRVTVTTADAAVAASDLYGINQRIEGARIADLKAGTASAKQITIQFGVKGPAGTYCVALRNSGAARSYIAEYTIAGGETNTDVVKSVTLTMDTAGTWVTDNTTGIDLWFGLMCGSTFQTTAGIWTAGNFVGSANQFNLLGTNGNVFELFDVGLYEGAVAPAFQLPEFASELVLCQRYFEASGKGPAVPLCSAYAYNTTVVMGLYPFKAEKRVAPTFSAAGVASDYGVYRSGFYAAIDTLPTMDAASTSVAHIRHTHTTGPFTAGQGMQCYTMTAAAQYRFNARL